MATTPQKKAVCKAALLNLEESATNIMRESFRQFRIHAVDVSGREPNWLTTEKFDACVLPLEPGCAVWLDAIRSSPLNRHMVIYGVSMPGQHLREVSKFGINVMLSHPLDRQSAIKTVRSTHLLVLHEFRRYVRIPVITEVHILHQRMRHSGTSVELSGGGMSIECKSTLKMGNEVEASFTLPHSPALVCRATVSWIDGEDGTIGIRFDSADERRAAIKKWIEDYLEI